MREDAYIPELPADSTEVRITAFMTAAAPSISALSKIRVNGLMAISVRPSCSRRGSV
ncbi:hypothetical protein D3C80_1474350 [compost metagenome]